MKKIALTSLLAVFTASGAMAANVIDGNPLYMPAKGHFYSVSAIETHTKNDTPWGLSEEFGYGVMDNLAVNIQTDFSENKAFDEYGWDDLGFQLAYRVLDKGEWKLDILGGYGFTNLYNHPQPKPFDSWFDKGLTDYAWTVGVRGGYTTSDWTVAGHALFTYVNSESFNWNEDEGEQGVHMMTLGLDAQYVICPKFSVLAGVEYTGIMDKEYKGTPGWKIENAGTWDAELGVNYNIDATKYVGLYVNGSLNHQDGDNHDEWGWDEGFGYGVKFGIDF